MDFRGWAAPGVRYVNLHWRPGCQCGSGFQILTRCSGPLRIGSRPGCVYFCFANRADDELMRLVAHNSYIKKISGKRRRGILKKKRCRRQGIASWYVWASHDTITVETESVRLPLCGSRQDQNLTLVVFKRPYGVLTAR